MDNSISCDDIIKDASKLYDDRVFGKKEITEYLAKLIFELKDYNYNFDLLERVEEVLYQIDSLEVDKHTKREIFFMCISNLKNLIRFDNLIVGGTKHYSYAKIHTKIKKCLPFIEGNPKINIPINPNEQYLVTLNVLDAIAGQKTELNIQLLNAIYGKKVKAKKPILKIEDLRANKIFWEDWGAQFPSSKEKAQIRVEELEKLILQHSENKA